MLTLTEDTLGTIGFTPLVDAVSPVLDNASLVILPNSVPYNKNMGGTYNVTVDYSIGIKLYKRAFLIFVNDTCETGVLIPILPDFVGEYGIVTVSMTTDMPEYSFSFAPNIASAFSWCTFIVTVFGKHNDPVPG